MRRQGALSAARAVVGALLALALACGYAAAQPLDAGPVTLLLEVSVNHWPKRMVGTFQLEAGRLSLPAEQFEGLGFVPVEAAVTVVEGQRRVALGDVPGLTWRLDMSAQTIDIEAPFEALAPASLSVAPPPSRVQSRSGWGALVGYDLFGEWALDPDDELYQRFLSGDVEARLIAPSFTFGATASFFAGQETTDVVRLDTALEFDRPATATTLVLGDAYSSSLTWTRSIRFGGVQYRRDFGLRPDLITQPMPAFSTGLSTPTAVDVFVNGVERYAADADPGQLQMRDLPVVSGTNRLTVVLTDNIGRRREVVLPFYASPDLLAPGLSDFSLEAGVERLDYGSASFAYGKSFASASFRRGLSDTLTFEAHGEATGGLLMAGGGVAASLFNAVLVSADVAASGGSAGQGAFYKLGLERTGRVVSGSLQYEVASDGFRDVAAVFGQPRPRSLTVASASARVSDNLNFSLAYVKQDRGPEGRSEVATGTVSQSLFDRKLRIDLNGYADLAGAGDWGVTLSFSVPFGRRGTAIAGATQQTTAKSYFVTAYNDSEDGVFGWRANAEGGANDSAEIDLTWEALKADVAVHAVRIGGSEAVQGELGQSLVLFGGALYLSSRVDEAFAVVDVGPASGVRVFLENRPVGRTNAAGRLFVNRLRGEEANSISIDPHDLPLSAQAASFSQLVAPRRNSGVLARFAIDAQRAALVVLVRADGTPPPVGSEVRLAGAADPANVGHGGEAYLRGVAVGENAIEVTWPEGACRASFQAPADLRGLPRLEATPCR